MEALFLLANNAAPVAEQAGRMMQHGMRGGGGMFLGGLLMNALWTILLVLLVLWVVRNWAKISSSISGGLRQAAAAATPASATVVSSQTPLEILQVRYAKGEITREEYESIRRDLLGETPIAPAA